MSNWSNNTHTHTKKTKFNMLFRPSVPSSVSSLLRACVRAFVRSLVRPSFVVGSLARSFVRLLLRSFARKLVNVKPKKNQNLTKKSLHCSRNLLRQIIWFILLEEINNTKHTIVIATARNMLMICLHTGTMCSSLLGSNSEMLHHLQRLQLVRE